MLNSILLIETRCPRGHVELYRALIRDFQTRHEVYLASTEDYLKHFSFEGLVKIELHSSIQGRNRYTYRLRQMSLLFSAAQIAKVLRTDSVILLSFDTLSFGIVSHAYPRHITSAINHNNIDEIASNFVKTILYRITCSSITHLFFEEYICEHVRLKYCVTANAIAYPCIPIELRGSPGREAVNALPFVFCPSGRCSPSFLLRLRAFCQSRGYALLAKPNSAISASPGVIILEYFEDYDRLLCDSQYVAIGVDFAYRVSGVFYQALANDKPIIFNDCLFSRSVAQSVNQEVLFV